VCFLLTETVSFVSTEIRKAGVMIQFLIMHYLNTYFRMFITLSIKFYSFEHRSYSTAKRVVWNNLSVMRNKKYKYFLAKVLYGVHWLTVFLYNSKLCSYGSEKRSRNGRHPRPLSRSKLGLPWGTSWWCGISRCGGTVAASDTVTARSSATGLQGF
jgi:hypothetical protein